ncbi:AgmX/PglI C-terminal domain-containing protein [Melittangium boletus]|uniref:AgmX/PglI C-terminal domain-containing protein n=1 Tax=Melittangium boletus TaxID=83453 RepID=UPI003DA375B5
MKHSSIVLAVVLAQGLALAQGPASGKKAAAPAQTKPAASVPEAAPAEKKSAAPTRPPPPDINRLPFTPDTIRQVMQYHAQDIQECYEEVLALKGSTVEEGRILTTFTISPDGFVRDAKVAKAGTTLKNERLNQCVVNVLTGINFPPPPDKRAYPIEYPFNLKAIK